MKRKLLEQKGRISQWLLAFLCILIAGGLVAFLYWYRTTENEKRANLANEIDEYEAKNFQEENWQVTVRENKEADSEISEASSGVAAQDEQAAWSFELADGQVFSIRGDGFYGYRTTAGDTGIANLLQGRLTALGHNVTVKDYTLDMAGTMTQMQHAGVSGEVINAYITAHVNMANGVKLPDTEHLLRRETAEQLVRDDQDAIAIIGIGYDGGFNNDVNELIEQQEKILETYSQQDNYLILGYYPASFDTAEERAAYDEAMNARWGAHYVDVNAAVGSTADVKTPEVRTAISNAIAEKLTGQAMG